MNMPRRLAVPLRLTHPCLAGSLPLAKMMPSLGVSRV